MKALSLVRQSLRGYVLLNVLYYGLVAASIAYTHAFPQIQTELLGTLRAEFPEVFPLVVEAYVSGNFPLAAALTFLINLVLGSFAYITLPSLILPFGGVAFGCMRAVAWGLVLAPTSPELALAMIPHSLTLILEGQGYILAIFVVFLQWKGIIWPSSIGEEKRSKAYLTGIKETMSMYILVALVLAVSAIYEAFEVIYIVGTLQ